MNIKNLKDNRYLKGQPSPKKIKITNNRSIDRIPIKSVLIGQYSDIVVNTLQISGSGLQVQLPNKSILLEWCIIKSIELSQSLCEPCLFISIKTGYLEKFHNDFNLTSGCFPCHDPHGTDDEKYVMFYLVPMWFEVNRRELRNRLAMQATLRKEAADFFKEVSEDESNRRQMKAAEATLFQSSCKRKKTRTHAESSFVKQKFNYLEDSTTTMAIYPPPPTTGGIVITNKDVQCLQDGQFLNDVIIDFYLKYVMNEILPEEDRNRSHVFSSFFFKRLTLESNDLAKIERKDLRFVFDATCDDLIDAKFSIMQELKRERPLVRATASCRLLNFSPHKVFYNRVESVEKMTSSAGGRFPCRVDSTTKRSPCILLFDSMLNRERENVIVFLRDYLNEEWKSKKSRCGSRMFNRRSMRCVTPSVPQQDNHYDCGVFLLHFVEMMFKTPVKDVTSSASSLANWFPLVDISLKRFRILDVITDLQASQVSIT